MATTPYGRGAWTVTGHSNGSKIYEYISGKPQDGSEASKGGPYQAVNLGIRAIQSCINKEGYTPALVVDGILGPKSDAAIRWYQNKAGLKVDGKAGAVTCRQLWRTPIKAAVKQVPAVDPKWIYGQMAHESSGDPGACGYFHDLDRGLNQINVEAHPEISLEQAHDPYFSNLYSTQRFAEAMKKYGGKTPDLQINCSILAHNSPRNADIMYDTGTPATAPAADYITSVRTEAQAW